MGEVSGGQAGGGLSRQGRLRKLTLARPAFVSRQLTQDSDPDPSDAHLHPFGAPLSRAVPIPPI